LTVIVQTVVFAARACGKKQIAASNASQSATFVTVGMIEEPDPGHEWNRSESRSSWVSECL
jgi:hypothetical protein